MSTTPRRPSKVQIGPYGYSILWSPEQWSEAMAAQIAGMDSPDVGSYYGFTDHRLAQIWVNPHTSLDFQREALLHEIQHGCQFVAALYNNQAVVPEVFITRTAPILLDVLRRNTSVRRWLFETP